MTIDPDELLIFKNRKELEKKPQETKAPEKTEEQLPAVERPQELMAYQPSPASAPPEQQTQKQQPTQQARPAQQKRRQPRPARAAKPQEAPKEQKQDISKIACTNHPWRPSYALCSYCGRPFCYADTMNFHGKIYCIEDIDQAARIQLQTSEPPTSFLYLTSLLFASCAVMLVYLIYQPAIYVLGEFVHAGLSLALLGLINRYLFITLEMLIVVLNFVAAVLIIRRTTRIFAFGAVVITLSLMVLSYVYLSSNAQNLYLALALTVINVAILSLARMSTVGAFGTAQLERAAGGIEWPRPESF